MGIRMRRLMLSLVTIVVAVTLSLVGGSGVAVADGVCFNGHNWDNVRNQCV